MNSEQKLLFSICALGAAVVSVLIVGAFIRSAYQSSLMAVHAHPLEFACAESEASRMHPACLQLQGKP